MLRSFDLLSFLITSCCPLLTPSRLLETAVCLALQLYLNGICDTSHCYRTKPANSYRNSQQDATMYQNFFIIPCLHKAQHVSGDTPPIIGSSKLH